MALRVRVRIDCMACTGPIGPSAYLGLLASNPFTTVEACPKSVDLSTSVIRFPSYQLFLELPLGNIYTFDHQSTGFN